MNLHDIANSGFFGSGKRVRDMAHARNERRKAIPDRKIMNPLAAENALDAMVASFGNCGEDGRDYFLNSLGEGSTIELPTAGQDARALAALWNAYMDGDLVWADEVKS